MADLIKKIRTNSGDLQIDYESLANKPALNTMFSNPNLLINSDFRNPVNQRGQTSYTGSEKSVYTIDRWCTGAQDWDRTVEIVSGGVKITNPDTSNIGTFQQLLERTLPRGNYTVTVQVKAATGNSGTVQCGGSHGSTQIYLNVGTNVLTLTNATVSSLVIFVAPNSSVTLEWVKLEAGSLSTPFVPRIYAEEIVMCQRYYEKRIIMFIPMSGEAPATYYIAVNGGQHFATKRINPTATAIGALYNQNGNDSGATIKSFTQTANGLRMIQLAESCSNFALRATVEFDAEKYE